MFTASALCAIGAEKVLSNELKKSDLAVLEGGFGRVRFEADLAGLWRALLGLRTADRILLEVARFEARDFDQLFEGARAVAWEGFIPETRTVVIDKVRTRQSILQAETSIQAIVHKAVAGVLCEKRALERLSDWQEASAIRVYIEKDLVTLTLDLSGEPLFRRGWRSESGAAPLRETTAAAILLYSLWRRKTPLYDPFCGSGTFLVEALLYAWDVSPGLGRAFTLSDLPFSEAAVEAAVRTELRARIDTNRHIRICGSDADPRSVAIARSNLRRAWELAQGKPFSRGLGADDAKPKGTGDDWPLIERRDLTQLHPPHDEGLLISNPPWGERLGDREEAEATYRQMGILKERFPLWKLAFITNHQGFESHFGYAASDIHEMSNGSIRSWLFSYDNTKSGKGPTGPRKPDTGRTRHVDRR